MNVCCSFRLGFWLGNSALHENCEKNINFSKFLRGYVNHNLTLVVELCTKNTNSSWDQIICYYNRNSWRIEKFHVNCFCWKITDKRILLFKKKIQWNTSKIPIGKSQLLHRFSFFSNFKEMWYFEILCISIFN